MLLGRKKWFLNFIFLFFFCKFWIFEFFFVFFKNEQYQHQLNEKNQLFQKRRVKIRSRSKDL